MQVVESALMLLNPAVAGAFTQTLLDSNSTLTTTQGAIAWIVLILVQARLAVLRIWHISITTENVAAHLRTSLFTRIQSQHMSYFNQSPKGDSMALVFNDGRNLSRFIAVTVPRILPSLLLVCGAFCLLATVSVKASICMLVFLVAFTVLTRLLARNFMHYSVDFHKAYSGLMAFMTETIESIQITKAFSLEKDRSTAFKSKNTIFRGLSLKYQLRQNLLQPLSRMIGGLFIVVFAWVLSNDISSGNITLAELVSIILYGTITMRPLGNLSAVYGLHQRCRAAAQRIDQLFDNWYEDTSSAADFGSQHITPMQIKFSNVCFSYQVNRTVLKNTNLVIDPGETVAIIGDNGAGKSTIAKLLLRFAEPDSGLITIGGNDLNSIPLAELRGAIGYVPQNNSFFAGTVRENLALQGYDVTDSAMLEMLKTVGGPELLHALPQGLLTQMGESGVLLSGGQCQKIALARALLKKPSLLILDEATSMFDIESEQRYVDACRSIYASLTVILISHREVSLKLADRTIRLNSYINNKSERYDQTSSVAETLV